VEPEEGQFNRAVLLHYRDIVRELGKSGLEPVVTLNHFTLPRWVARQGGWASSSSVEQFGRFTDRVAEFLGEYVRTWVTINEPMVLVYMGYLEGKWPPGRRSRDEAIEAVKNLARAHGEAYRKLHQYRSDCRVGIAKHLRVFEANSLVWPPDHISTWLRGFFFNDFLLQVLSGKVPPLLFGLGGRWAADVQHTLDFIGVNYYTRDFIRFSFSDPFGVTAEDTPEKRVEERNSLGWEIYPEGFYQVLLRMKKYKLPVMVLENGICTLRDERRVVYIKKHIRALFRAMAKGVDVQGYFYWSLMDNFEWVEGFEPRFGLVEIDYKTQRRKPRESAAVYREICRSGTVGHDG